ncbi:MAG: cytochrome c1 [Gammaproteobacteria bacterium]|jgi:ubiquinol-cytochrome c reductase cytochrome c1 subunit|nr:cytochrome c1 [Gammaproteobacteria bacterium]MBU0772046.1 cytochrome c1 [Gammaproteobacteria bacterium]MBU0856405.1 cytochrome c1 [Gammaproteobacteria bacterium]MBU1845837.1 cytochrome c1 [Gammaproteobacteria bacterium]
MKQLKKLFLGALCAPLLAMASSESVHLDRAPTEKFRDAIAIQRGAQVFVNYCLNCHSASYMRYNRLHDVGLSDNQIKDNLLFAADKVGETMKIAMTRDDGKQWFGAAPPDLSVIARSRASGDGTGADWLYTYLRTFYRDEHRPTGWNNTVFANVGMPHVLYELQGEQTARHVKVVDAHGHETEKVELELTTPGKLSKVEYDSMVGDLVAYLVYMGEPGAEKRRQTGLLVLLGLSVLLALTYLLKREFWKDVH